MQIKDRVFLATGGASGLGKATCEEIVKRGGYVTVMDCNAAGEQVAAELGERALWPGTVDVTSEADVMRAIQQTKERFGAIHGALNIAGVLEYNRPLVKEGVARDLEGFKRILDINLVGPFNVMRLAAVEMLKQEPIDGEERGVILNVSSVAREDGLPNMSAYTASKAGLASLSLPLAREFGLHGIRVFSIAPGGFRTPMTDQIMPVDESPVFVFPNRTGTPQEFAKFALDSVENQFINGTTLTINGASIAAAPVRLMFYQSEGPYQAEGQNQKV